MNQVALVENITDDPELRYTQSDAGLASFTVAVSHRSKHNGEWQDVNDGLRFRFRSTHWRSLTLAESPSSSERGPLVSRVNGETDQYRTQRNYNYVLCPLAFLFDCASDEGERSGTMAREPLFVCLITKGSFVIPLPCLQRLLSKTARQPDLNSRKLCADQHFANLAQDLCFVFVLPRPVAHLQ